MSLLSAPHETARGKPLPSAWLFLAVLLACLVMAPQAARANDRQRDAGELKAFRGLVPADLYETALQRLHQHPEARIRIVWHNLCASRKDSFAWNLDAAASLTYERANAFAEAMQKCPKHCAPGVNGAVFCDYVRGRKLEIQVLKAWDKGFFEAYNLMDTATRHARLPEEQLSVHGRLVIRSALEGLRQSLTRASVTESSRKLSLRELREMRLMFSVLADAGILKGGIPAINAALKSGITALDVARRAGRKRPDASTQRAVMLAAADLAWLARSLDASAEAALRSAQQKPSTTAADPRAMLFGREDWTAGAAKCLNRLSLDASTAAGGIQSELELIGSCRDTSACPAVHLRRRPSVTKLLGIVDMSFKEQAAITGSMCKKRP